MAENKKRRSTSEGMMVDRAPKPYERPKPSFSVQEGDLPEIKTWTVGKKYKLSLEVEMVSHSKGEYTYGDEPKKHEARLRVVSIKPAGE